VLCLRIAVFTYLYARTQQRISKGAFAGMLVESVSLWLGLSVAVAAAYAVKHAV
jgi:uncharacterized protein YfaQ (DUF2300 family)